MRAMTVRRQRRARHTRKDAVDGSLGGPRTTKEQTAGLIEDTSLDVAGCGGRFDADVEPIQTVHGFPAFESNDRHRSERERAGVDVERGVDVQGV